MKKTKEQKEEAAKNPETQSFHLSVEANFLPREVRHLKNVSKNPCSSILW